MSSKDTSVKNRTSASGNEPTAELKNQVLKLETLNNELGAQLTEKYGSGELNLETGEITVQ